MDGGGEGRSEALIEPPWHRVPVQIGHLEASERIHQLTVLVGLEGVACQTDQASSWSQKRHHPFQMEARDASLAAVSAGSRIGEGWVHHDPVHARPVLLEDPQILGIEPSHRRVRKHQPQDTRAGLLQFVEIETRAAGAP